MRLSTSLMARGSVVVGAMLAMSTPSASARNLKIQAYNLQFDETMRLRALEVRDVFVKGWQQYRQHAWGHDEVTPLTLNYSDTRNGWGASMVDALTTMTIMGLDSEYREALEHLTNVDFTQSDDVVSVFESTIRYVGSMISAYELSSRADAIFKSKALRLAEKLSHAWVNGSVLPFGYLNFTDNSVDLTSNHNTTNLAEAGTLIIEMFELSKHSDNITYVDLAERSMKSLMTPAKQVYPGLVSRNLDPMTGRPLGDLLTWDGGADSYYEYLIKYALLTGNKDSDFLNQWWLAVDSSIHHLLRKSSSTLTRGGYPRSSKAKERYYLASTSPKRNMTQYSMSHLACFAGGNWMLGGKMLDNSTIFDLGLALTETCADSYSSMPTGIGPESFNFLDKEDWSMTGVDTLNMTLFEETAISAGNNAAYLLRPEVIESFFYAYRMTGDKKWQEKAYDAFQSFRQHLETPQGLFAPLVRVDRIPSRDFNKSRDLSEYGSQGWQDGAALREQPEYKDVMESFWWGETLKYLYLIFAPPNLFSLDEYVFTTEAHPFRIHGAWLPSDRPASIPLPPASPFSLPFATRQTFGIVFMICLVGVAVYALTAWRRNQFNVSMESSYGSRVRNSVGQRDYDDEQSVRLSGNGVEDDDERNELLSPR